MKQRHNSTETLSSKALAQLETMRGQGLSYDAIAVQIPVAVATLWKAAARGKMSRSIRMLLEARLEQLSAGTSAPLEGAAA